MNTVIRKWKIEDAADFTKTMLSADSAKAFAFAVAVDDLVVGSIGVFRCDNIHFRTAETG